MSQPCSLVELILVDARDLGSSAVQEILRLAEEQAVPHGALGINMTSGGSREQSFSIHALDFWFTSVTTDWPFERAAAFAGVEHERALFVSMDASARNQASGAGMLASEPDVDHVSRLLP